MYVPARWPSFPTTHHTHTPQRLYAGLNIITLLNSECMQSVCTDQYTYIYAHMYTWFLLFLQWHPTPVVSHNPSTTGFSLTTVEGLQYSTKDKFLITFLWGFQSSRWSASRTCTCRCYGDSGKIHVYTMRLYSGSVELCPGGSHGPLPSYPATSPDIASQLNLVPRPPAQTLSRSRGENFISQPWRKVSTAAR